MIELFKLMGTIAIDNSKANQSIDNTTQKAESSSGKISGAFKKLVGVIGTVFAVSKIVNFGKECVNAWNIQKEAEVKLETVMKQRMNATDKSIQSVKNYASELQKVGVVGDEVQLAGAQQLATFLNTDSALKTLMPAMNNLAVQQKGVSATSGDLVNIGNLMGKVMQGQTSALKRVGITFDEHQEKLLKTGTEQQRAAVLAQVITDNVGEMNKAMRQTDAGKIQAAKNSFGDLQEEIGKRLAPVISGIAEKFGNMSNYISANVLPALDKFGQFLKENRNTIMLVCSALISMSVALSALKIILSVVAYVKTLITAFTTLKAAGGVFAIIKAGIAALGGPITIIIAVIGALVGAFLYLWNTNKSFRTAVIGIWNSIKSAASSVFKGIANVIMTVWNGIKSVTSSVWNGIKSVTSSIWNGIKSTVTGVWNAIKSAANTIFKPIGNVIKTVWNGIKSVTSSVWSGIKSSVTGIWNSMKSGASSIFKGIKTTISNAWSGLKNTLTKPFSTAWDTIKGVANKIKNAFNFKWSLPKLSLPHISVSGGKAPFGIGGMGSLPKFKIDWYAKAMDEGIIMNKPTAFGINRNGEVMAGGEVGSETVVGTQSLMDMITNAVASMNAGVEQKMDRLIAILEVLLRIVASGTKIELNSREFARLVRGAI